jgi:hypothetical protein
MTDGWFYQSGIADDDEAEFLVSFASLAEKLPALGIRPEHTDFEGPLGVGGSFLLRLNVIDDVFMHVGYFPSGGSHRAAADWSFDGYVLDGGDGAEFSAESPTAAGGWAADWVAKELERVLIREEWDGRLPHNRYRFENERVGRHWFRKPDRSIRVR